MNPIARKTTVFLFLIFLIISSFSVLSTVSADYYPVSQNLLTIGVNYPGAGSVTPGSGLYNYGSTVTARVFTNPGFVFDGWYLNGVYQGKLTTIPITMTQDYTLYAVFSMRTACLTITSNPSTGGSTAPGSGIWNYTYGTTVTIYEYPSSGGNFSGWYLDGSYLGLGTSVTINMTQDHQLGAFFAGTFPTPTATPQPTATPTPQPTPNLPIPTLSFYCASSTTSSGFTVQIQGALAYNNIGISGTGIAFSYSANGGASWHDLAYLITGDDGNFSAVWMPSASGNYLVQGYWRSDGIYSSTSNTVNFAVAPYQNQNTFSVSSNSTLSSLTFDSTQSKLAFSVSGPSGTTGYVQACIPKTMLTVASNLKVSLDGNDVVYDTFSSGDSWIITIEYHHSSHSVVMTLDAITPTPTATSTPTSTSNPTSNPTQTTDPTPNSTPTPTATLTTAPSPTLTTPEFSAIVIVPLFILMMGLAVFLALKKRAKDNTPK